MVMCETAHCAFDKGGFYLDIEIRKVNHKDFRIDLEGIKNNIDSNTIALVASSPDYAYGNFDRIPEVAALAQSYGIGCHSDCCLGSYVNPFITELGYKLECEYDFKVPGVTTVSCDPHKYAYGPKGCSLLLFRDKKLRERQFFTNAVWNGGFYATTCIAGSRPGSVIAGTWASMKKHGRNGLKEKARKILLAQTSVRKQLSKNPDVKVTSYHDSPIISFTSATVNGIALAGIMHKKYNWTISKL